MTSRQVLSQTRIVPRKFYERPTLRVARDLLGKLIIHRPGPELLAGRIVETEAYLGVNDPAAHTARGRTERTRVIFGPPGHAYVYLCYGMYDCLNLVTEPDGAPGCVLIRALEPVAGLDGIRRRRPKAKRLRDLASGPGKLTMALGIGPEHYGADVTRGLLTVRAFRLPRDFETVTSRRVGISAAQELPYRFYIKDNEHVSGR